MANATPAPTGAKGMDINWKMVTLVGGPTLFVAGLAIGTFLLGKEWQKYQAKKNAAANSTTPPTT